MGAAQGRHPHELVWTVVGASAGSLVRHWVESTAHGVVRSLVGVFVLAGVSAALIGFAATASSWVVRKTALLAAGGAGGSVGVAAERAAVATPTQSAIGLAVYIAGAVLGLAAGRCIGSYRANREFQERW